MWQILKKCFLVSIISWCFFLWSNDIFAANDGLCGNNSGYSLYECRTEKICEVYKSEKPVYSPKEYEDASSLSNPYMNQTNKAPGLDAAKKTYRENMGNIYKCALVQTQKNTLSFLKKQISAEESWELTDTIGWQIDLQISRLEISAQSIWCSMSDSESIQNKLNVLRETTYEMCRYVGYLEYMKEFYHEMGNSQQIQNAQESSDDNTYGFKIDARQVANDVAGIEQEVAQEIAHTYKVFPIAYQAYTEYENTFPLHYMLVVIRWDFMVIRQALYETLMPIAQLGLKVINAMSY